jgi:hypothetical protein
MSDRRSALLRRESLTVPWLSSAAIAVISVAAWASCASPAGSNPPGAGQPARRDPAAMLYPLSFESEVIRLTIVGDSLEVNGTYFLACRHPFTRPISLFYPFPADSLLEGARMIDGRTRIQGGSWQPLQFETLLHVSGVRWWAPPCSAGTIEMEGHYRQGLKEKYGRYIVTTTRAWQHPLRHARFEIRLPKGAEPIDFSFPFQAERDSSYVAGLPGAAGVADSSARVYVWETDSFFPDRDIVVRWR